MDEDVWMIPNTPTTSLALSNTRSAIMGYRPILTNRSNPRILVPVNEPVKEDEGLEDIGTWEYYYTNGWNKYDDVAQQLIEKAWKNGTQELLLTHGVFAHDQFTVYLRGALVQKNNRTGTWWNVRRVSPLGVTVTNRDNNRDTNRDTYRDTSRDTNRDLTASVDTDQNPHESGYGLDDFFVVYFACGDKNTIIYSPNKFLLPTLKSICNKKTENFELFRVQNSNGEFIEIKETDTLAHLPGKFVLLSKEGEIHDPLKLEALGIGLDRCSPGGSTDNLWSFRSDPFKQLMKRRKKDTKSRSLHKDKDKKNQKAPDSTGKELISRSTVEDEEKISPMTLDAMVDKLILNSPNHLSWVFLVYPTVCTSPELLSTILEKFKESDSPEFKMRCIDTLLYWIDSHRPDFERDYRVGDKLSEFYEYTKEKEKDFTEHVQNLLFKRAEPWPNERPPVIKPPEPIFTPTNEPICFLEIDSLEFARQLTLAEEKLFISISSWEFIYQTCRGLPRVNTLNIDKMVKQFNYISFWAQTEILTETERKRRTKVIEKMIDICGHLYKLGNYNGLLEIVSALESTGVNRLKHTWTALPENKLSLYHTKIQVLVSMSKLREAIMADTPPLLPYLGLFLTEFIQIDEGNPSKSPDGLLNLSKQQLIAKTLSKLTLWQKKPFNLQPVPQIQDYINNLELVDDEDTLTSFSKYLEPKSDTTPEIPPKLKELAKIGYYA